MINNLNYDAIGKRIRKAREKSGMTQEVLANICDLSETHISNIENGNSKLSLPALVSIANALDTTVDHLLIDVIDNNQEIITKEINNFFKNCTKKEIENYLVIPNNIKELNELYKK